MRVDELSVPQELRDSMRGLGITELYPPQAEAVEAGLLKGENILVATPTASGKTLLAVLAAYEAVRRGGKAMYLSPLRALTTEKAHYFARLLEPLGCKVAAVSRDYDSPEEWLKTMDIVIATYEKADSLVRHRASWLRDIGLVVIDELHLLSDPERGPRLEVAATSLMRIAPEAQRLGLSATVTNAEEVCRWLGAKPIVNDWRPVQLREYVYHAGKLYHLSDSGSTAAQEIEQHGNPLVGLTVNCVLEGGQVLVFASSRRRAEIYAESLSKSIGAIASLDRAGLRRDAERIRAEGRGLEMAELLASCVERGVGFHHAGLIHAHRSIVEGSFLERRLKVICATPTLAAGVNIPARLVLIPEPKKSTRDLTIAEYKQLAGRAGRPGFDEYGYSIIIAAGKRRALSYVRRYLGSRPEPIESHLNKRLDWGILAALSSGIAGDEDELEGFLQSTFMGTHSGVERSDVTDAVERLRRMGLIKRDALELTRIGKRVAELCVEPITAVIAQRLCEVEVDEDVALAAVASSPDVPAIQYDLPLDMMRIFSEALERLVGEAGDGEGEVIGKGIVLKFWVNEVSAERLANTYDIAPGDLLVLKESAEWVSSALAELLLVLKRPRQAHFMMELSERIRHGVKPELIRLCAIEGVGRVRARHLYNAGFRTVEDVARAPVEKIAGVHGIDRELATKIKLASRRLVEEVQEA